MIVCIDDVGEFKSQRIIFFKWKKIQTHQIHIQFIELRSFVLISNNDDNLITCNSYHYITLVVCIIMCVMYSVYPIAYCDNII